MAEDTFTMDDAEAAVSKAGTDTTPTSFTDAFSKAMSTAPKPEAKAKEEPSPVEEKQAEPIEPESAEEAPQELEKVESRSAKDFRLVKQRAKEAVGEVEKLRAEIAALKTQPPDNNDTLEALKQERDELSTRLKEAALEKHPKFESYYRTKIGGIIDRAKTLVGEDLGSQVESLLKMSTSENRNTGLDEIFGELSVTQQAQLGALLTQMDEVTSERSGQLKNASATYEQMETMQTQQREAFMAESERTFSRVGEDSKAWGVFQDLKDSPCL